MKAQSKLSELLKLRPDVAVLQECASLDVFVAEEFTIVDNKSRLVSGTKTLHHLLPDLFPPMDGKWTGRFFEWGGSDLRSRQAFLAAWRDLQRVAAACHPTGWSGPGGVRVLRKPSTTL